MASGVPSGWGVLLSAVLILPLRTDAPLRRTPVVNYALILLNVVIFSLQVFSESGVIPYNFGRWALRSGEPEIPTFLTYAFLHGTWWHLVGNMIFLYIYGNNVSSKLGQVGYLLFYLAGSIFAGVVYVMASGPNSSVVGASGGVAAVTGAYLVLFPRSFITIFYFFILIGVAEIPAMYFILFTLAWNDIITPLLERGGTGVAHSAHLGGYLFGVSISLGLLGARLLERDQYDLLMLLSRWNRRRQFQRAVASGWDPYMIGPQSGRGKRGGTGVATPEAPPDPRTATIMDLRAQVAEAMAHRNLAGAAELYLKLRGVDPNQVLSRNAQLDIANQLAEMGRFSDAVQAYDLFLRHYPDSDQHPHIELLAGVIYSRYLNEPGRAMERIQHALPRLSQPRDIELARAELARLSPPSSPSASPPPYPGQRG